MGVFLSTAKLQIELFLLMALGFFCKKRGLIQSSAQKSLSNLLIYVILPCNILHGFLGGVQPTAALLRNCLFAFLASLVIQLTATFASHLLFRRWPRERSSVASYGIIVSNSSFIGIPIAEHLFGDIGVMYTSLFQIPIRFTMWSAGLALFTTVSRKETVRRIVTHPCILACLLGLVLMLTRVSLPGILDDTVLMLSRCTGPMSMLIIGAILAGADWRQLLRRDVLTFCLYRLILFPLLVLGVLRLLGADSTLTGVAVLLTAMPAGSTTAILPQQYNCDAEYGAALIFTSTAFSVATIPLLSFLL